MPVQHKILATILLLATICFLVISSEPWEGSVPFQDASKTGVEHESSQHTVKVKLGECPPQYNFCCKGGKIGSRTIKCRRSKEEYGICCNKGAGTIIIVKTEEPPKIEIIEEEFEETTLPEVEPTEETKCTRWDGFPCNENDVEIPFPEHENIPSLEEPTPPPKVHEFPFRYRSCTPPSKCCERNSEKDFDDNNVCIQDNGLHGICCDIPNTMPEKKASGIDKHLTEHTKEVEFVECSPPFKCCDQKFGAVISVAAVAKCRQSEKEQGVCCNLLDGTFEMYPATTTGIDSLVIQVSDKKKKKKHNPRKNRPSKRPKTTTTTERVPFTNRDEPCDDDELY